MQRKLDAGRLLELELDSTQLELLARHRTGSLVLERNQTNKAYGFGEGAVDGLSIEQILDTYFESPKNDELHDATLAVYKAQRAHSLQTFEMLCDQAVIAQTQLRDANDPERRALKAGREAVEKRNQLNEELQY